MSGSGRYAGDAPLIEQPCACFLIPPSELDAIHVFFIDRSSGVGYVTIICFGQAWTAFFGAMNGKTIREFFCGCDVEYLTGKMSRSKEGKADRKYLAKIIGAAKAALA